MQDDPLWVDVSELMQNGTEGVSGVARNLTDPSRYFGRLLALIGITDVDLHIDEVTGDDKTLDVIVDIFNRVNSGGTKLRALLQLGGPPLRDEVVRRHDQVWRGAFFRLFHATRLVMASRRPSSRPSRCAIRSRS